MADRKDGAMSERPHERLDRQMTERGLEIKKRWVQIAKEAGISTSALSGIRRGEYGPSGHTARALDVALMWAPGSVDRILEGGDPQPLTGRTSPDASELSGDALDQAVLDAAERLRLRVENWKKTNPQRIKQADRMLEALDDERDIG